MGILHDAMHDRDRSSYIYRLTFNINQLTSVHEKYDAIHLMRKPVNYAIQLQAWS